MLKRWGVSEDRAIWFEHGASEPGSALGCGVDHAHLHLIIDGPFSFDQFASEVSKARGLKWERRQASTVHHAVKGCESYLVAASAEQAVLAQDVEQAGSQFFRRVIAKLADQPEAWNYRTHPHLENVRESIKNFAGRIS